MASHAYFSRNYSFSPFEYAVRKQLILHGLLYRTVRDGQGDNAIAFPAIHLSRQLPFYGPPGHIGSRDGIDLCPSSVANPSRHRYKAHRLARWFAGRTPTCHRTATHGRQSPVSAQSLTFLQFICHGNRHSTGLQGTLTRAMFCRKIAELTQNSHTRPSELGWRLVPRFPAIHLTRQSPF